MSSIKIQYLCVFAYRYKDVLVDKLSQGSFLPPIFHQFCIKIYKIISIYEKFKIPETLENTVFSGFVKPCQHYTLNFGISVKRLILLRLQTLGSGVFTNFSLFLAVKHLTPFLASLFQGFHPLRERTNP